MISDRYENYLKRLLFQTESSKIHWRPIKEFLDTCSQFQRENGGFAQYVSEISYEWCELFLDKSFFVQKNGYSLALLHYKEISGKDGSEREHLELIGGIHNCPVKHFPEYIEGGFPRIQEAIINYWERKILSYSEDVSDSFEILNVFTEGDCNSK